jgi:GAF domain-containing protein
MTTSESTFVAAVSVARESEAAWKALENLAKAVAGHVLFTVTVADVSANVVRRAFSNRPGEYATSETKPLRGNTGDWFETVFNQRRTFVANTIGDIAEVFPDHELIGSMGLGSVVNFPVVLGGELVATINLLDVTGHYTPARVAAIETLLAIPARLCAALALQFDGKQAVPG